MRDEFHTPVLADIVLSFLQPKHDFVYVDATLGGGGHAERILAASSPDGRLIAFDADADAVAHARLRLERFADRMTVVNENFSTMKDSLARLHVSEVGGILFDLGVSSRQIDDAGRGFSFRMNDRLDMRMDRRQALDAEYVVNRYDLEALRGLFRTYGEEQQAARIARAIVRERQRAPVTTTGRLAEIIRAVVGQHFAQKSFARIFQAIRIEVNHELEHLRTTIEDAIDLLAPSGRLVVISYHSLEDRIVKETFKKASASSVPSGTKLLPDRPIAPRLRILTKKPVGPSEDEIESNPRARSARLRAAEKVSP